MKKKQFKRFAIVFGIIFILSLIVFISSQMENKKEIQTKQNGTIIVKDGCEYFTSPDGTPGGSVCYGQNPFRFLETDGHCNYYTIKNHTMRVVHICDGENKR